MRLYARAIYEPPSIQVSEFMVAKYEHAARKYWDHFYQANATNFYKDRHYLDKEFPELASGAHTVLEVGCGVGNTVYPLLELNPRVTVFACDFSATAVRHVQQHPLYGGGRVTAFVADITCDDLLQHVPAASVDACTMVFVLSAISREKMPQAIANVARTLQPGRGKVLLRDYARGDLAQARLESGGTKQLSDSFFVRGDGTRCYYFEEQELVELFKAGGFVCEDVRVHVRDIQNRKRELTMHRRWIQAVFRYQPPAAGDDRRGHDAIASPADMDRPGHCATLDAISSQQAGRQATAEERHVPIAQRPPAAAATTSTPPSKAKLPTPAACTSPGHPSAPYTPSRQAADSEAGCSTSGGAAATPLQGCDPGSELQTPASAILTPGGSGDRGGGSNGGSRWLSGPAGRLAGGMRGLLPGAASGRALLPESLDDADEEASSIMQVKAPASASCSSSTALQLSLEEELERQFFDTIGRDTHEVVAEEVAAANVRALQLFGVPPSQPHPQPPRQRQPLVDQITSAQPVGRSPERLSAAADASCTTAAVTNPVLRTGRAANGPTGANGPSPAAAIAADNRSGSSAGCEPSTNRGEECEAVHQISLGRLSLLWKMPVHSAAPASDAGCSSSAASSGPPMDVQADPLSGCSMPAAAAAITELLLSRPELTCQRRVLVLSDPTGGLCTIAALQQARRVVAAAADEQQLQLLLRNLERNSSAVVVERARCRLLQPAAPDDDAAKAAVAALQLEAPSGYDLVLAAVDASGSGPALQTMLRRAASCMQTEPSSSSLIIAAPPSVCMEAASTAALHKLVDGGAGSSTSDIQDTTRLHPGKHCTVVWLRRQA